MVQAFQKRIPSPSSRAARTIRSQFICYSSCRNRPARSQKGEPHMFSSPKWRGMSVRILLICFTLVSCVGVAMSQAQSNAADLQGTVRDPSGAAVKGATVTARNLATNISRDATSNDDGIYQILSLPPGNYEVTAEAQGFSKAKIPSVTLTVGQRGDLDIPMAVGDVNATVNISTADVALADTTSTAVAN